MVLLNPKQVELELAAVMAARIVARTNLRAAGTIRQ